MHMVLTHMLLTCIVCVGTELVDEEDDTPSLQMKRDSSGATPTQAHLHHHLFNCAAAASRCSATGACKRVVRYIKSSSLSPSIK